MSTIEIICGIVMLISAIAIILLVLVQSSPKGGGGISALTGGGDSFYSQNKARTKDAVLTRLTKVAAAAFFIITMIVYAVWSYGVFQ